MENVETGLTYQEVREILRYLCNDAESKKDYLTDLDSSVGDGDLGISVSRGFLAVEKSLEIEQKSIGQMFIKAGMEFTNSAGSTMGALFGMALMRAGKCIGDTSRVDLNTFFQIISCAEESIKEKGKAQIGDKTMLDALDPARESLKLSLETNETTLVALEKAYLASEKGSESTKNMQASSGRARWLGDRTVGFLDPGAVFVSLLMKAIYEKYKMTKSTSSE